MYEAAQGLSTDARFSILTTLLVFVSGLMVTLITYIVRFASRMARTEEKVSQLVDDITKLVGSKEKDHERLAQGLSKINESTDKRLRYLEENFWRRPR